MRLTQAAPIKLCSKIIDLLKDAIEHGGIRVKRRLEPYVTNL